MRDTYERCATCWPLANIYLGLLVFDAGNVIEIRDAVMPEATVETDDNGLRPCRQRRSGFGDSFFRGTLVPGLRLGMHCSRGSAPTRAGRACIPVGSQAEPGNQNPLPRCPAGAASVTLRFCQEPVTVTGTDLTPIRAELLVGAATLWKLM